MLDRRVVEILTNLYREIGHRHWRLGPLRFPCYSERPNIWGNIRTIIGTTRVGYEAADGVFYADDYRVVANQGASNVKNNTQLHFNANAVNNLYQDAISTVQPKSLRGLWILKAY